MDAVIDYKLYYLLLGCTPYGRYTEQHDVFFCIGSSLKNIIPDMLSFWPDAGKMHIDCWREVTNISGYHISVHKKNAIPAKDKQLFFLNLGGYLPGVFEEHHYKTLIVAKDLGEAIRQAKQTDFYKEYTIKTTAAVSHVDNKYGVDIDDMFKVEDILPEKQKQQFSIVLQKQENLPQDELYIGYLNLDTIQ